MPNLAEITSSGATAAMDLRPESYRMPSDTIWRMDWHGGLIDLIDLAGKDIAASPRKSIHDLLPPHTAQRLLELVNDSIASKRPETFEFAHSRNERLHHLECQIVPYGMDEALVVIRDASRLWQAVTELQVILETVQGVSTTSSLRELLDYIYHSINRFLYADNFFVALQNSGGGLEIDYFVDKYQVNPPSYGEGRDLARYAMRIAEPMLLTADTIEMLVAENEVDRPETIPAAWLSVPLRTSKSVLGILVLQHYDDPAAYRTHDLELLVSIGDQIGVAIERKRSEEAVQNSRDYLDRIINSVGDPIFVKDEWQRFALVNESMCKFLGRPKAEVIGASESDFFPAAVAAGSRERDEMVLSTGEENVSEERFSDDAGQPRVIVTRKRLYVDKEGEKFIVGVINNITERRMLEEKLQRAQKLESIGQLAAGIAHEINTPTQYVGDNIRFLGESLETYSRIVERTQASIVISGPDGYAGDLADTIAASDLEFLSAEVPKAVEQALDGVGRISKIVQSIKDFAHPGTTEMSAVDLNNAIESTITVASNEWKYVAEVVTDYDPELPPVHCLAGEFNQVILNMIVNAAHAIAEVEGRSGYRGQIRVSTRQSNDHVEIVITDNGAGMRDEVRERIFDPFFTTKQVGRGTGQGLAISHSVIVEKHHGTIDVESRVGHGTIFTIRLPILT